MLPKPIQALAPRAAAAPMSRRGFLLAAGASAAGLAIGFRPALGAGTAEANGGPDPFQAYLEIADDGTVTVLSSQFEMGQGAYHGLATLVVEELGCAWSQVTVVGAAGDTALYGNLGWGGAAQGTGGSTSMVSSWKRYRTAGAAAKAMLVAAAAADWRVPAGEIAVEAGQLSHAGSGRRAGFGAYARAAAQQPVPAQVALKAREAWSEIGNPERRRYDRVAKTTGEQDFTVDLALPGMLTAVMIHPPRFGATLAGFDASAAREMPGVVDVAAIPRGVAVVARDMWSALQARERVTVDWDDSAAETRSTSEILSGYRVQAAQAPAAVARAEGDVETAFAGADRVLEATYEFPFLAHAALEPLNAAVRRNPDGTVEVWGGHQLPDLYQHLVAQSAGVAPDRVHLHVLKTGGSFGRRAVADGDVVIEAAAIARALGWRAPVKVQWTRENDMRGGRYRPAYVHRLRAALDAQGELVGWDDHIVGQSILKGTPFESVLVQNGIDKSSVEGAANLPYAVPNLRVGLTTTDVGVPVLWWRAVGSTHNAYAVEVFLDEVAAASGRDPVALRLALLGDHPRHAAVLRLAADKAGWGKSLPAGRAQGVAVHESFASFVAQVAEVSVTDGRIRVHRVVCAADCGTPINPDTIRAQLEGGIGFGLSAVMGEEVTLTDGEVDQGNYDRYRPLRIDAMPAVETHLVESREPPTGIGEPGVPPIGPAVANAVYRATGQRLRVLPFTKGLTG
jgi:isoquinoline 1-oxidoreductase beta subunit